MNEFKIFTLVYNMVHRMVHHLQKNTVMVQDFFVVHTCTKSLHKAHKISGTKISNSLSPGSWNPYHCYDILAQWKKSTKKKKKKENKFIEIFPMQTKKIKTWDKKSIK